MILRMKTLLASVVAVLVLGLSVACKRPPPPPPPPMEVRLVTSLPLTGRWEREAERGLGRIAANLGAEIARIRAESGGARRDAVVGLGGESIDLVFCVGPGFDAVLFTEAPAYQSTRYVSIPGGARGPNVAGIDFLTDGVGYLAGAVAATLATSADVGILRGAGGPWLESLETGFIEGVHSHRSKSEVPSADGVDGAWNLRDRGVRVALYATARADAAVLAAAHDAGVLLIVTDPDVMRSEPDLVIAAVDIDVAEAMLRVAREVHDGTFEGRVYAFDLGSGILDLELNQSLPIAVAPPVRDALETARSEVTAGFVEIENLGM